MGRILERRGWAADLVTDFPDPAGGRTAVLVHCEDRAVVLGSTQRETVLDPAACAAAGAGICRRRSGGGAVLVAPGSQVWFDCFVPRGDPLAERDVGRGALVLGSLWADVLGRLLPGAGLEVHRGAMVTTRYSRLCCFSGLAPGEVTLEGRKVVGVSQRRDRSGTWLFSMGLLSFSPDVLASLFRLGAGERADLAAALAAGVGSLPLPADALESELAAAFSSLPGRA